MWKGWPRVERPAAGWNVAALLLRGIPWTTTTSFPPPPSKPHSRSLVTPLSLRQGSIPLRGRLAARPHRCRNEWCCNRPKLTACVSSTPLALTTTTGNTIQSGVRS